jgi:Bacteriophage tail sheath protein
MVTPAVSYPGVYVQEVPSGVRTIVGVSTSIGLFIGTARKGPMFKPVRCTNYQDFVRAFSDDPTAGQLAHYVRLFFLNGGFDCFVMRIADGATQAFVELQNEAGDEVLRLTAKDPGLAGENIRALVTYNGPQPETTFNIDLFRLEIDPAGNRTKTETESWKGLTMDPASPLYAVDFITQNSKLVSAAPGAALPAAVNGFSLSGRAVPVPGTFEAAWETLFGNDPAAANTNRFQISVGGSPYVEVDLSTLAVSTQPAAENGANSVKKAIEDRFTALGILGINVAVTFPAGPAGHRRMRIEPAAPTTGDVFIRPAAQNDLAVPLMLGTAQGGLEVSGRAAQRPAPNGITFSGEDPAALNFFGDLDQSAFTQMTLDELQPNGTFAASAPISMTLPVPPPSIVTVAPAAKMREDANAVSPNGNSDGIREKFAIIAERINSAAASSAGTLRWKAEVWGNRLAILPTNVADNFISNTINFTTVPAALANRFRINVNLYSVGNGGANEGQQTSAGGVASDGNPPVAADYQTAYDAIDKEEQLFNLMVLPPDAKVAMTSIYPNASVFCKERRAFLLMDPPASWTSAQIASTGVAALRVGLVKDYSAIFFPRITIDDKGLKKNIGASGAIAGLCARTDNTRGVWKAPAGTEADLRGILGLEQKFSDRENGILNPRAVNTIRIFPNGIVNWGARTMDGDDDFASEYKYIPIRRLALFIEESLYRGLKWVVFEPNDEPLYAQIRLNVGAFIHNLFRQGAFQGQKPVDAYFVKCDKETTTQNDRNLGIVNIWVGFAPLKPAEFVILYLQQMAGQIEV